MYESTVFILPNVELNLEKLSRFVHSGTQGILSPDEFVLIAVKGAFDFILDELEDKEENTWFHGIEDRVYSALGIEQYDEDGYLCPIDEMLQQDIDWLIDDITSMITLIVDRFRDSLLNHYTPRDLLSGDIEVDNAFLEMTSLAVRFYDYGLKKW